MAGQELGCARLEAHHAAAIVAPSSRVDPRLDPRPVARVKAVREPLHRAHRRVREMRCWHCLALCRHQRCRARIRPRFARREARIELGVGGVEVASIEADERNAGAVRFRFDDRHVLDLTWSDVSSAGEL
jgi:hypothetical protein